MRTHHRYRKHNKHHGISEIVSLKPLPQQLANPLIDGEFHARENIILKQGYVFWMMCFVFLERLRDMKLLSENEKIERKSVETDAFIAWRGILKLFEQQCLYIRHCTRLFRFRDDPVVVLSRSQMLVLPERRASAGIMRSRHNQDCPSQLDRCLKLINEKSLV